MMPPCRVEQRRSPRRAFTLIEMLVAVTIAALMVVMMANLTNQTATVSKRANNTLLALNAASAALDLLVTDLDSLAAVRGSSEFLQASPDAVDTVNSTRLYLLALSPTDVTNADQAGQARAVLYRVAKQNPLGSGSGNQVYGLYRTALSANTTFSDVIGLSDLSGYAWSASPVRDDFLVGNVAQFRVLFYAAGNSSVTNPAPINLTSSSYQSVRIAGNNVKLNGANYTTSTPATAEISLTILEESGALLFRNGSIPIDRALREFGHTLTRRVTLRQPLF
ncbi:MAG: prepilin-type N-terminal cleavage/methylation domain-containing protein [Candidatus Methylacidiphilales bacterium]|nr:prepilin-type N-terminal cleavage/methylation domain-containing protein [Candidatus Methylacidiphilales bacterium]